jgi:hypothetical protein
MNSYFSLVPIDIIEIIVSKLNSNEFSCFIPYNNLNYINIIKYKYPYFFGNLKVGKYKDKINQIFYLTLLKQDEEYNVCNIFKNGNPGDRFEETKNLIKYLVNIFEIYDNTHDVSLRNYNYFSYSY